MKNSKEKADKTLKWKGCRLILTLLQRQGVQPLPFWRYRLMHAIIIKMLVIFFFFLVAREKYQEQEGHLSLFH